MEAAQKNRLEHVPRGGARQAITASGAGAFLILVVLAACMYVALDGGGTGVVPGARMEVLIALGAVVAGVAFAAGALQPAASRPAWAGAALLVVLALWSALATGWSPSPDEGWLATNRIFAYAGIVAICLMAAPAIRGAPLAFAVGFGAIALLVAAYALGGKLFPTFALGPIDLDHASFFARLRSPLGYWNALALLLVMAIPICLWIAGSARIGGPLRCVAWLALQVLLLTIALTYSRGAVVVGLLAVIVMVALGPERLPRLAVAASAAAFAAAPIAFAFSKPELTENGVAAAQRSDEGALLALCLAGSLVASVGAWRLATGLSRRTAVGPGGRRRIWTALAAVLLVTIAGGFGALALSDDGVTGTVQAQWDEFREPAAVSNEPARLVSASSSNRWVWWREAAGAFSDKPVEGWGSGSFPILHTLYSERRSQIRSAHSVPLQLLAENGIIGAVLFVAALGALGFAALRGVSMAGDSEKGVRAALFAAYAAWAVHSLYDWDWEIPAVTLPALAAAAIAASPAASPSSSLSRGFSARRGLPVLPTAVGAAVVAALFAASAILPALAETHNGNARTASVGSSGKLREAAEEAALAQRLNPLSIEPLLTRASLAARAGNGAGSEELLVEAARLQPDNYRVWERLIQAETLVGNGRVARIAYENYARTNPLRVRAAGRELPGSAFAVVVPPRLSPTAVGTPPP